MIRTLLVVGCVVLFALALAGMRAGWVHRGQLQADLPILPSAPAEPGAVLIGPQRGLYVGTTTAGRWQDRVVARGLGVRADATLTFYEAGLVLERAGGDDVFIPVTAIAAAGVGAGLAGKVLGPGGLLLVRWRLGAHELDTGWRADDKSTYPAWVQAIDARADASPAEGDRA